MHAVLRSAAGRDQASNPEFRTVRYELVCLRPSRSAPRLRPSIGYVALIGLEKVTGRASPEAVYFVSKAGAKVFNVGSIRWSGVSESRNSNGKNTRCSTAIY